MWEKYIIKLLARDISHAESRSKSVALKQVQVQTTEIESSLRLTLDTTALVQKSFNTLLLQSSVFKWKAVPLRRKRGKNTQDVKPDSLTEF